MTITKRFSPELRERAVRLVFDQEAEHSSQWPCIEAIAPKIGCTPQTLRTRIKQAEVDQGRVDGDTTSDRADQGHGACNPPCTSSEDMAPIGPFAKRHFSAGCLSGLAC